MRQPEEEAHESHVDGGASTTPSVVREIAADHRAHRGALLPILHAVQEALGCVPPEAIPVLADELNLSRADVHGVVTFYHDFRSQAGRPHRRPRLPRGGVPVGRRRTTGGPPEDRYGMSLGDTRYDGSVTVEQVFCLGNCALGPAVQVNGRLHGRVDEVRLSAILDEAVAR